MRTPRTYDDRAVHSFDDTPFNRAFRFEMRSRSDGGSEIALPVASWFEQEYGIVHGGVISSLADTAAVYSLRGTLGENERMTSVEFKINFLMPATMTGGSLVARANAVRRGRTIGVCDVDVRQGNELIAKGLFTYLFLGAR